MKNKENKSLQLKHCIQKTKLHQKLLRLIHVELGSEIDRKKIMSNMKDNFLKKLTKNARFGCSDLRGNKDVRILQTQVHERDVSVAGHGPLRSYWDKQKKQKLKQFPLKYDKSKRKEKKLKPTKKSLLHFSLA